jgi:AcrR family transcriptional regulator
MAARREQIVDAALALAEEVGWHDLHLYDLAARLDLPLAALQAEVRDRDAIANAWFERALRAALAVPAEEIAGLAPPVRLERVMLRWFAALAPHRRVTAQMLREKAWPGHPHHWVPLAFDLSRLMHWFLDAARIASTGLRRQLAEVGLTALFLGVLAGWLVDADLERARRRLARGLAQADRWLGRLPRRGSTGSRGAMRSPPE